MSSYHLPNSLSKYSDTAALSYYYMFHRTYLHTHVTLFAGLLSFHLDLGMEPSLEGGLWLANPSVPLHSHSPFCLYGKKHYPI